MLDICKYVNYTEVSFNDKASAVKIMRHVNDVMILFIFNDDNDEKIFQRK